MECRTGEVVTVDDTNKIARIRFDDSDNLVSGEIGWLNNEWSPTLGANVLVVFTNQKVGYIIGSIAEEDS